MGAANYPRRRHWLRVALIATAVLIVLSGAFVAAVSWWVRPRVARALSDVLGTPVSIDALSVNPFTGALTFGSIAIDHDAGTVGAARLIITPALRTVWRDDIVIARIELVDVHGQLQLDEHFRPVLGGLFNADADKAASTRHVTIRETIVRGGTLTVRYPVGERQRDGRLDITILRVADLDVGRRIGIPVNMSGELDGAFDAAPLHASGSVNLSEQQPIVGIDFSVQGLHISPEVVQLPPPIETFTGVVDVHATKDAAAGRPLRVELRLADAQIVGKENTRVAAKAIAAPAAHLDFDKHTIEVGDVTLEQPLLAVRLTPQGIVVPITPGSDTKRSPWTLTTGNVRARDGLLLVLEADTASDFALQSLDWDGMQPKGKGAFKLEAAAGEGTLNATGTLTVAPPRVALDARFEKLPIATLSELAGALPLRVSSGVATGNVTAGYSQQLDRVGGHVEVHQLELAPPNANVPSEMLAVNAAAADFTFVTAPMPVADITSLTLSYPYALVRRSADGVFPYSTFIGTASVRTGKTSVSVRVADLAMENGKIEFLDTMFDPVFWSSLTDVSVHATRFAYPTFTVDEFAISGKHDELSPTTINGSVSEEGLRARAELRDVLLETLNAYVSPALGYRITAGRMTTIASAEPSPPLLTSKVDIVLRGVDLLQTGHDVVGEQSGVPLPIALGLISDLSGDIHLSLPIAFDPEFQRVSFGSVFWQAFRQAVVTALTSPLRLLGSLFGTRGAPHAFAVDPVPFAVGSGDLDRAGRERIAQIRRIVTAHQRLTLVLLPQITDKDIHAVGADRAAQLAEQRAAAVSDAFIGAATDPIAPQRVILAPWKPETKADATGQPGVYVELQDVA